MQHPTSRRRSLPRPRPGAASACGAGLWGLALGACLVGAAASAQAGIDQAAYVALGASVFRVEAPRVRGGYSIGSAVAVAPDIVVTNCHVTRDAREISIVRGDVRVPVQLQASMLERDLCVLKAPGLAAPPVRLGRAADLKPGESVTAIGFTGGIGLQKSVGEVISLHRLDGGEVVQSTNWFSSGASGGGLFNDRGDLVGVLTFRLRGGEAHYFSAPIEWLVPMLEDGARGAFREVEPLDPAVAPYWQKDPAAQPLFLQAAVLQRDQRWGELESLAGRWARSVPDDAEPWYTLGMALSSQGRRTEARAALACALRLNPNHQPAQERLLSDTAPAAPATLPACPPAPH